MRYFPAFFDLRGQRVLVVGGGEVALRKVSMLERAGAAITVTAPRVLPELADLAGREAVRIEAREFVPADLDGVRLAIVATSHRAVNRWIAKLCDARAIPVNVVDDREASRFIVPAIIDRDPVMVAVSTGGASPVLARRLRERLEAAVPRRLGEFASWLRNLRPLARERLAGADERRRFFESLVDGAAARRFCEGDRGGANRIAQQALAQGARPAARAGEVTLVGAGPGDPELLTLKALRALQDADVILHDRLVPAAVLDYARRDALIVCVGKTAGGPGTTQERINELLIEHARLGRRVVRLKGGDPLVFGRGGEELEALALAGIDFRVVPGVTAAVGAAAYAGIPLTHRDFAHGVSFVTGHADAAGREPDWRALAAPGATVVFYMGGARIAHIVARLLEHGAPAGRPAAVVAAATTDQQRVLAAPLGELPALFAARTGAESPALLIVGEVAALHGRLRWFEPGGAPDLSRSA